MSFIRCFDNKVCIKEFTGYSDPALWEFLAVDSLEGAMIILDAWPVVTTSRSVVQNLAWRVRTARLAIDTLYRTGFPGPPGITTEINLLGGSPYDYETFRSTTYGVFGGSIISGAVDPPVTSESDLVCLGPDALEVADIEASLTTMLLTVFSTKVSVEGVPPISTQTLKIGSDYRIPLHFDALGAMDDSSQQNGFTSRRRWNSDLTSPDPSPDLTFDFFGFAIPLYNFVAPEPGAFAYTATISVSPLNYWGYDPGDGLGPIWDTATGAQLRDPFSIAV